MKLLYAQLFLIGFVWIGMFPFRNETEVSYYIFLLITTWFLFLLVITIKNFIKERKEKAGREDA